MTQAELDKCATCSHTRFEHEYDEADSDGPTACLECKCERFVFDSEDHARRVAEGRP